MDRGGAALDEAFALADARGLHDHAARALVAQARESVEHREPAAEQILDRAIAYAEEHELDGYRRYALGFRALRRLDRGAWKDGEIDAREAISGGGPGISSFPALVALGRFQTLRGEPAATATLDQVAALARRSGELLRIWPATVVRAEHAWLAGELAQVAEEVGQAYEHALAVSDPWMVGELAFWRWRAGALAHAPPAATEPYRLSIEGDWQAAADAWQRLGCMHARAQALTHGDQSALRQALAFYKRHQALAAADRLRVPAGSLNPSTGGSATPEGITVA